MSKRSSMLPHLNTPSQYPDEYPMDAEENLSLPWTSVGISQYTFYKYLLIWKARRQLLVAWIGFLVVISEGEFFDPFVLLKGERWISFLSGAHWLSHPMWQLHLFFPADFSLNLLGSFIWIIDILMVTAAWIFEIGYEWALFKDNYSLGMDQFVCTLANLDADTWAVFTAGGQDVVSSWRRLSLEQF